MPILRKRVNSASAQLFKTKKETIITVRQTSAGETRINLSHAAAKDINAYTRAKNQRSSGPIGWLRVLLTERKIAKRTIKRQTSHKTRFARGENPGEFRRVLGNIHVGEHIQFEDKYSHIYTGKLVEINLEREHIVIETPGGMREIHYLCELKRAKRTSP